MINAKKNISLMFMLIFLLFSAMVKSVYASGLSDDKYIAIIIDDFGNGGKGTKEMLELSIPFTAAVMPNAVSTEIEAEALRTAGKGIILHMPMEPIKGKASWMGKGGIMTGQSSNEVRKRVTDALDQLKYADGLNNHMGSKVTGDESIVEEILNVAKERDLIVVDSKTTDKSKMKKIAEKNNVKFLERDIFIDAEGKHDMDFVEKRLMQAGEIAKKYGYAIAIGHVGAAGGVDTARAIEKAAPVLMEQGIKFVTIKELYTILQ